MCAAEISVLKSLTRCTPVSLRLRTGSSALPLIFRGLVSPSVLPGNCRPVLIMLANMKWIPCLFRRYRSYDWACLLPAKLSEYRWCLAFMSDEIFSYPSLTSRIASAGLDNGDRTIGSSVNVPYTSVSDFGVKRGGLRLLS